MPELPEVEVTRRSFADRIASAEVLAVSVGKPLRWALGCEPDHLLGERVIEVSRRGKYLLARLTHGWLIIHLGMSGSLSFSDNPSPAGPHDHFDLFTSRGVLRLHDPRRFGAVVWVPDLADERAQKLLARLGVEPLDPVFTTPLLYEALRRRRAPIKQVLLDGRVVVGVGNIYASEALFAAGIRPSTRSDRIGLARAERLRHAIVEVLSRAVAVGGSTLRDFSNANGEAGYFQLDAMVYGREGQPCRRCGGTVRSMRQGQRSTYFCAGCQR